MAGELCSQYRWRAVEGEVWAFWEAGSYFHAEPDGGKAPYCIVIPPPNVTAALHMGHALNNTLQDILIRYHRMAGENTVWLPGTDHAGIATQTVVEKRVLAEEGKRRTDFERDEFVAKIQAWKDEYEGQILGQLRAMGCSCDWSRTRFTMDAVCARAVREAFFRLFEDGLIYRGKRLVNWDPATQTALADDEVETHDVDGHFWYLQYPLVESVEIEGQVVDHVTVATTRPETMLGDTAVAMNPRDPRAKVLVGKGVRLPIVNRLIPIIEDDYVVLPDADSDDVKAQFATGFLKVTPAHDPNDWEIGQRHDLPIINVMGPDGAISDQHGWEDVGGAEFVLGLDRYEAREAIVEWFRTNDLLEDVKPYRHIVGHSYRSHVPIEPYLSDQWYVKVTDERLAGAALRAMAGDQYDGQTRGSESAGWEGQLRFYPERYAKTFQAWHENIRDWCVSRQLWWGHRIPVWRKQIELTKENYMDHYEQLFAQAGLDHVIRGEYPDGVVSVYSAETHDVINPDILFAEPERSAGEYIIYVCYKNPENDKNAKLLEKIGFERDPDVLDTWFSSALWPFSTLGWPEESAALAVWNPGSVLCTAREIITLWVSRMVMTNLYFLDRLPFRDVFIHAMVQDGEGRKMSKSLGNGIDPLDIIEQYGADAMRYSLACLNTGMQDLRMPVKTETLSDGREINTSERFEIGRNVCTKLWNAARLVLTGLEGAPGPGVLTFAELPREDRWILSRLNACVEQITDQLGRYVFADASMTFYRFFWNEFCDWYLEWVKSRLYGEGEAKRVAQQVSAFCLDRLLRLGHPFMPYITEKLWGELNGRCPVRGIDELVTAGAALVVSEWPTVRDDWSDASAEREISVLGEIIRAVRDTRANVNRSRAVDKEKSVAKLPAANVRCGAAHAALIAECMDTIRQLGGLERLGVNPEVFTSSGSATRVITDPAGGTIELAVPLAGLIDVDRERTALGEELTKLEKHIQGSETRLANPKFARNAPPHIVAEHRRTLEELKNKRTAIQQSLEELR